MTVPVLVALAGTALESSVVMALQHSERAGVHIVRRCVDVADLVAAAATGRAVAALVADDLPHLDADVVAALRVSGVEPLGVVTDDSAPVSRLHQIGVTAVLVTDGSADLAGQVVECLEYRGAASSSRDPTDAAPDDDVPAGLGEVVAVWGPAGAPGRTTVATGLASEMAELGQPTLLVDADVYGGAVAQHLAMLDDVSGLLAAARNAKAGVLDPPALATHCRTVGRTRVLTGLPRPDRWPELSPAAMSSVLASARALSSYVVVDCGFSLESDEDLMFDTAAPRRNGATLCVLEQADRVLAVGAADPVGLSRLARGVVDLTAAVPGCRPTVVVNRMRPSLGWSATEATAMIERFTDRSPGVVLPEDRTACDKALVHGKTLAEAAPASPLRTALRDLAADLAGVSPPGPRRRRGPRRLGRVS